MGGCFWGFPLDNFTNFLYYLGRRCTMILTFKGQCISVREFVDGKGDGKVRNYSCSFLEVPSGKLFYVFGSASVPEADLFRVGFYTIEGVISSGKSGLYIRADKIGSKF